MIQSVIESGIIHIFKGKQTIPIKLVIGEILTAEIMDIFSTGNIQIKINNRILNAQTHRDLSLNKGDIIYVKVEKPFPDGTIPLRVLSTSEVQLTKASEGEEISQIIKELPTKIFKFIDSLFTPKQEQNIETEHLNLFKTLLTLPVDNIPEAEKIPLFEKLIEFFSGKYSTSELIKDLVNLLYSKESFKEVAQQMKNMMLLYNFSATTPEKFTVTEEKLKKALLNSGVAFESKLKKVISEAVKPENIREDLKTVLNNIIKEARAHGTEEIVEKAQQILRQIEGFQVLSKMYQSFFTFLPVLWKDIEGGNFAFKSFKRQGKDYYTVFVSLKIKDDESLSFVVTMIKKTFFVSFSGGSEILQFIKNYEAELKERFHDSGMVLGGINYFTKVEELIKHWSIKEGLISVTA
uniref:Flagellar hook-length control protein FliK n=1 Tax=Thermodesulfovibrio aggregans TaxID=86166 RepID=A0A7C4AJS6_9BACT